MEKAAAVSSAPKLRSGAQNCKLAFSAKESCSERFGKREKREGQSSVRQTVTEGIFELKNHTICSQVLYPTLSILSYLSVSLITTTFSLLFCVFRTVYPTLICFTSIFPIPITASNSASFPSPPLPTTGLNRYSLVFFFPFLSHSYQTKQFWCWLF